jgi:mannose-1-phosphate guanylyltransferase
MIQPIILAGGSGTRLWPLSRTLHPKQFMSLVNETTLFQEAILRLPVDIADPIIICNEDHRFLAAEQLREIQKKTCGIILEPIGKNTAPAVALAAIKSINNNKDPILLVLSADHLIKNYEAFHKSILIGEELASDDKLVTFGINPTSPETGYGYIEVEELDKKPYYSIKSFTEKPDSIVAKKYIKSNSYLWNSGIFMFKASEYLSSLEKFEPEILICCEKSLTPNSMDFDFIRLDSNEFNQCPDKSIDYAVMEKTENGVVVPLDADWTDIGSWESLYETLQKDQNGNVKYGDFSIENVTNSYINSPHRLVVAMGLSNLIIVDTKDTLLIIDKKYSQKIKNIVKNLKDNNRTEVINHRKVFRPWGYFDLIESGENFQVKRILVNPGAKLSLQKHQYRSEHWVVVKGLARITCGTKIFELKENQSTYIAQGETHRLENQSANTLEIIEIQTGSYLGEDDIIRLEDDYKRD